MADATSTSTPRVEVLALGGTIAMSPQDGGGVAPALSAEALLAAVPGLQTAGIDIRAHQVQQLPGASLTLEHILALAADIRARLGDVGDGQGTDGVVVVQGTDTIEETAYLLDILHTLPQPIVVTGAMRNPTQPGADGPANLDAAIRTAASPAARGLGCLVVMSDQIHAAAQVRKTHTSSTAAFTSPGTGPIGSIAEGTVTIAARPADRLTLPIPALRPDSPRVGLYTVTLGDTGHALAAFADQHDGLVIAGFGVGHVPAPLVPILKDTARRIPVVLASRTGAGSVHTATYGFPGSERDLIARGLIPAGDLDSYKARIYLYLHLLAGANHADISAAFRRVAEPSQRN